MSSHVAEAAAPPSIPQPPPPSFGTGLLGADQDASPEISPAGDRMRGSDPGPAFWSKVDAFGDCWEWTGWRNPRGYGQATFRKRTLPAHRIAWELLVGPIPEGLELDHLCRNNPCVNPDHLEPVTPKENMRRRRKTHCVRGHRLTESNLVQRELPDRHCLTCSRERPLERYYAKKGRAQL